ncbi:MAG: hypothetical protein IJY47_03825 [Clostridia bacterium]|nr:hypothetical protein [Clostridia bacterium]
MKKLDPTVLRETQYIALWVIIFSMILQAIFLIIGKWNYTVLLGNVLSGATVILNFLMMGITIQKAVTKEGKEAKDTIKLSQSLRSIFLFVIAVVGVMLPCFSTWTTMIPLFFPRIAIAMRPLFRKNRS